MTTATTPMDLVDDGIHVEHFDDRSFKFRVIIYNEDGKLLRIKKSGITSLVIEDNILDFMHRGVLVFKNPHDMHERTTEKTVGESETIDIDTFRFRGDARDYLQIDIAPVIDPDPTNAMEIKNDFYTIRQRFVIYRIEDLPNEDPTKKEKRVYFHDARMQRLLETDLYWSSAAASIRQGVGNITKSISQLSNDQRAIRTGIGIKDMIQQALPSAKFDKNWDNGARDTFYTTPGGCKAFDDIMTLYEDHVSSDDTQNQPCLLRVERFTNTWSLLPLKKYFHAAYDASTKSPGPFQNETFYISSSVDETGGMSNPTKSPEGPKQVTGNTSFADLSLIRNFIYSEMPGEDNQRMLISTPVQAYDSYTKQFQFYHDDQAIQNMFQFFKNNITDTLMGGDSGPFTEFFINNNKEENKNVRLVATTQTDRLGSLVYSRNEVLKQALFAGPAITFDIKGNTNRRAGRFISLDRKNPYTENDFDSKLLGQYLVTRVTHKFDNTQGYSNTILGVKTYYFNQVNFNNNIK